MYPDSLPSDLAKHEADEVRYRNQQERDSDAAYDIIQNGEKLDGIIFGYQPKIAEQLARCMVELDNRPHENKEAMENILNALSHIQRILFADAMLEVHSRY